VLARQGHRGYRRSVRSWRDHCHATAAHLRRTHAPRLQERAGVRRNDLQHDGPRRAGSLLPLVFRKPHGNVLHGRVDEKEEGGGRWWWCLVEGGGGGVA
jgi:hypothetical protein